MRWLARVAVAVAISVAIVVWCIGIPVREQTPLLYSDPHWLDSVENSERKVVIGKWVDEFGRENGPFYILWPNGNLKTVGNHRNEIRHGGWVTWSEDGTSVNITEYRDGEVVGKWAGGDRGRQK